MTPQPPEDARVTKTARWLDLVAFLLHHRFPVTREDVFDKVAGYLPAGRGRAPTDRERESARRKFERDKDELRALGIGIETLELKHVAGDEPATGYRLRPESFYLPYLELSRAPRGRSGAAVTPPTPVPDASSRPYRLAQLSLSDPELSLLDRATRRLAERGEHPLAGAAASARRKLAFDLPLDQETFERVIGVPLADEGRRSLAVLQQAVAGRWAVACRYYSISRDADESREIEPWGLMFQASHWYCLARARDRDAMRVFRVDRMRQAQLLEGEAARFVVPDDFDVRRYLDRAPWELGEGPVEQARVRFGFPQSRWVLNEGRGRPIDPLLDDGGAVIEFAVRNRGAFLRWLLTYGQQAAVLAPEALAAELDLLRRKVRDLHA